MGVINWEDLLLNVLRLSLAGVSASSAFINKNSYMESLFPKKSQGRLTIYDLQGSAQNKNVEPLV